MSEDFDSAALTERERQTWSRSAATYLDTFAEVTMVGARLLINAAAIEKGDRVLDIGPGPGNITNILHEQGADIVGIDIAQDMVDVAHKHYPHLDIQVATSEDIPFPDSSFDKVVASYVVHHFARPDRSFAEIVRVLKPGGKFIFVVPREWASIGTFMAALEENHPMEEMAQGPLFFAEDINVFSDYLLAAGFQSCELDHRFVKWKASSVDFIEEGMWKFVGLDDLHKEIREKISADMHANAEAHRTDGGFEFEDGVLLGVATKK